MKVMRIGQWLPLALGIVLASPAAAQELESTVSTHDYQGFESPADWSAPNAYHKALARMLGSWDVSVDTWSAPGAKPERSHAEAIITSMMGGRYVEEALSGTRGGRSFEAHGVRGFNNLSGEVESVWFDNRSTSVERSAGRLTLPGDAFTLHGTSIDPSTHKPFETRTEVRFLSVDEFVVKDFAVRNGHDVKVMERVYSRK